MCCITKDLLSHLVLGFYMYIRWIHSQSHRHVHRVVVQPVHDKPACHYMCPSGVEYVALRQELDSPDLTDNILSSTSDYFFPRLHYVCQHADCLYSADRFLDCSCESSQKSLKTGMKQYYSPRFKSHFVGGPYIRVCTMFFAFS